MRNVNKAIDQISMINITVKYFIHICAIKKIFENKIKLLKLFDQIKYFR